MNGDRQGHADGCEALGIYEQDRSAMITPSNDSPLFDPRALREKAHKAIVKHWLSIRGFMSYQDELDLHASADAVVDALASHVASLIPQWQPIESAPKDGTYLLLYSGFDDVIVACFRDNLKRPEGYPRWRSRDCGRVITTPTHWMPLPAAPRSEDQP